MIPELRIEMNWQPCSQGTISSASALVRSRKSVETRRSFLKSASAAAVVVAGGGFAAWTLSGGDKLNTLYNNPNYPGGIACSEIIRILPEYIDESIKDAEIVENMSVHLAACDYCRNKYDMLKA